MKKSVSMMLAAVMAASVALAGCGSGSASTAKTTGAATTAAETTAAEPTAAETSACLLYTSPFDRSLLSLILYPVHNYVTTYFPYISNAITFCPPCNSKPAQ